MTLSHQPDPNPILVDWQQATEQAIEVGCSPLLELGMDRRQLNNLPLLLTLTTWSRNRSDLTQPLLLTGDVDALWPVPLFYTATPLTTQEQQRNAPPVQLAYGGADRATYLASLTTHVAQRLQHGGLYTIDLPVAMQPLLNMRTQTHANANWQQLPLTLYHRATVDQPTATTPTLSTATVVATGDDPWLAWAALVMIVALVLLAIFV